MNFLAKKITLFFIRRKQIEQSDYETFVYCFEILLSSVFNTVILLICALVSRFYLETAVFAIALIISRKMFGGFHAKTHFGCMSMLIFSYCVFAVLLYFVDVHSLEILSVVFCSLFILPVICLAPVSHPNNPLSANNIKKGKIFSALTMLLCFTVSILAHIYGFQKIGFLIAFPVACSAVAMLVGKLCYADVHFRQ